MSENELHIYIVNDPSFMENGAVIHTRDGGPCWIIDPGLPPQAPDIIRYVREHHLVPEKIILTHGHADHIAGVDEVRGAFAQIAVHMAKEEWDALSDPMANLSTMFGPGLYTSVTDPKDLTPGEDLTLDGTTWQVLDTSGHSPGGRSLYCAQHKVVIVGDALFLGSVGRVDFHHSDGQRLLNNIREHLLTLPDDTRVYPGHGPQTTIGEEKRQNPYIIGGF